MYRGLIVLIVFVFLGAGRCFLGVGQCFLEAGQWSSLLKFLLCLLHILVHQCRVSLLLLVNGI